MQKIIEIKDATVYRGETRMFDKLSLDLVEGQNSVILGPNGAGKSTFLKLLMRDLYPVRTAGSSVRLYGRERWDVQEMCRRFGIVSHDLQRQYAAHARGLDLRACLHYLDIICGLMQAGKTVATHHIHEIPHEISRAVLLKARQVIADGRKEDMLTALRLSALYDTPVELMERNSYYQAVPGAT